MSSLFTALPIRQEQEWNLIQAKCMEVGVAPRRWSSHPPMLKWKPALKSSNRTRTQRDVARPGYRTSAKLNLCCTLAHSRTERMETAAIQSVCHLTYFWLFDLNIEYCQKDCSSRKSVQKQIKISIKKLRAKLAHEITRRCRTEMLNLPTMWQARNGKDALESQPKAVIKHLSEIAPAINTQKRRVSSLYHWACGKKFQTSRRSTSQYTNQESPLKVSTPDAIITEANSNKLEFA